jgi:DNA-binding transcriptional LysR family regulator
LKSLLLFALGTILHPSVAVRDIDGVMREPLKVDKGRVEALFFVTNDCPVSNYYAHEIRRVCEDYATRGVGCALVYTDPAVTDDQAREHAREYGHGSYPKIVDRAHALVRATGAAINPTAVLIKPDESIAYRGRIDNFYAAIGKTRRVVTAHDLRDALDAVIAGRPVAIPEAPPVGCYIQ